MPPIFLRIHFIFVALLFAAESTVFSAPADTKAQPTVTAPPVPAPAFLDVVTFKMRYEGENHQMVVTTGPNLLRVDETDDRFSVIYDASTDHYTGLEHGNYTYWEFSWPEVQAALQTSQRYEEHLRDLNANGLGSYNKPVDTTTNSIDSNSASEGPDNAGYVWHSTTDKKTVAGLDCLRWVGDTVSGENVEAWCFNGPLPKVQAAMEGVRKINEPIALVPVRTLVPPLVFPVYKALVKGGVTPVQITWGSDQEKNSFTYVGAKTRDGNMGLFAVPKLYIKTTLVTMDGITNPVNPTPTPASPPDRRH